VLFSPSSRYVKAATYKASLPTGGVVTALVLPGPRSPAPIGYHPTALGDRLDLIAVKYLNDPTGFWRLLDTSNSLAAGALESRPLIGVPAVGS
jgi:hypothetical protein